MKLLILFKKFFSVIGAFIVFIFMYYGLDGYDYGLMQPLIIVGFFLIAPRVWNRRLYDALVSEQSESFKNSAVSELYYFLFEFFMFFMLFYISVGMGYEVLIFLLK